LGDKVDANKSTPPPNASLELSFFTNDTREFPIKVRTLHLSQTGTLTMGFGGKNTATVAATGLELWINICVDCVYAKEPEGFEKVPGQDEHLRHRILGTLNSGVYLPELTIEISPTKPSLTFYEVALKYACSNCGTPPDWQIMRALVQ
jgi:hypothetical protein